MTRLSGLLFLAVLTACADRAADLVTPDPTACQVEGMRNCAVSGDVLFGSQPSEAALDQLAAQGYTTVVTTRADGEIDWDERAKVESLGMTFVSIPMPNPVSAITDEQVARLDSVLGSGPGPVVLHCGSGNRVSGLWGAWLAEKKNVPPDEALRLAELAGMTGVRPVVEQRLGVAASPR
ncbi:MAG: sulfur transferase domain-containing protein [Gemmatimonadota bacterium]|nr:sulfur transferase domain-containing protein [Gemmatimonadota bacterium]